MITIKDLARELGLHHTTVSKALRNHPDISEKTRERVQQLARDLDYHPNTIAQSFKSRQSYTIGVIVPLIRNDFFSQVISGIEEVAYENGYTILICQTNDELEREAMLVRQMISNQVAGLAISVSESTENGDHFEAVKRMNIPLVFFDRQIEGYQTCKVVVNDYQGAYRMVSYLIERGCRRIAHLAGRPNLSVSKDRLAGYMDALKDHELPIDESLIQYGRFRETSGEEGAKYLLNLPEPPDAIFAVNDFVALGTYNQIKAHGKRIPEDICVAGFGNVQLSQYLDPPLTTVIQSPNRIGNLVAETILEKIQNKDQITDPTVHILDTELVIRESTR